MWTYSSNKEIVDAINNLEKNFNDKLEKEISKLREDFNSEINSLKHEINDMKDNLSNVKKIQRIVNYKNERKGFVDSLSRDKIFDGKGKINSAYKEW
jgi:uncharacterized protein YaaR (DUF327 family)